MDKKANIPTKAALYIRLLCWSSSGLISQCLWIYFRAMFSKWLKLVADWCFFEPGIRTELLSLDPPKSIALTSKNAKRKKWRSEPDQCMYLGLLSKQWLSLCG